MAKLFSFSIGSGSWRTRTGPLFILLLLISSGYTYTHWPHNTHSTPNLTQPNYFLSYRHFSLDLWNPALLLRWTAIALGRWWLLLISVKAHHTQTSSSSSSSKLPSFLLCHWCWPLRLFCLCGEISFSFFFSLSRVRLFYRVSRLVYLPIDYKAARPGSRKKKTAIDTQEKREDVYI